MHPVLLPTSCSIGRALNTAQHSVSTGILQHDAAQCNAPQPRLPLGQVAIKKMKRKYASWEECINLREVSTQMAMPKSGLRSKVIWAGVVLSTRSCKIVHRLLIPACHMHLHPPAHATANNQSLPPE